MAGRPNRLRSVLRLAKRTEEHAMRDAVEAERRTRDATKGVAESARRLAELDEERALNADDFRRHRQKAALRADQANQADERLRELLDAEVHARDELRGAVRRRRSLEELESRRLATQAGIAAHAAQRALDELAAMRRREQQDRGDDR